MKSIATRTISYQTAKTMVAQALAYAQEQGWVVAVAVSDPHGGVVAFGRDDAVAPPIGGFAMDKAYTAATLRKSTADFGARMASTPTLGLGIGTRDRLLTWGGGVAIFEDGDCVGAIGVFGAQDFEDIDCARHVNDAMGLTAG